MTCADKLRGPHALRHDGEWVTDNRGIQTWVHDDDCPKCLVAAVIEAAENLRDIEAETDIFGTGWFARHEQATKQSTDALSALARRLETQP